MTGVQVDKDDSADCSMKVSRKEFEPSKQQVGFLNLNSGLVLTLRQIIADPGKLGENREKWAQILNSAGEDSQEVLSNV